MVSPASHKVPRASCYSGTPTVTEGSQCYLRDFHPILCDFPDTSIIVAFVTPDWRPQPQAEAWFGLFRVRSPLLAESRLISSPAVTEMFQFSAFAPLGLYIQSAVISIPRERVSPFGYPRIKACLAAPLGLTQPTTSFIASLRLDIHHAPLIA